MCLKLCKNYSSEVIVSHLEPSTIFSLSGCITFSHALQSLDHSLRSDASWSPSRSILLCMTRSSSPSWSTASCSRFRSTDSEFNHTSSLALPIMMILFCASRSARIFDKFDFRTWIWAFIKAFFNFDHVGVWLGHGFQASSSGSFPTFP